MQAALGRQMEILCSRRSMRNLAFVVCTHSSHNHSPLLTMLLVNNIILGMLSFMKKVWETITPYTFISHTKMSIDFGTGRIISHETVPNKTKY